MRTSTLSNIPDKHISTLHTMPGTRAPRHQRATKVTSPQRILLTQKDTGIFPINITKQYVGLVLKIIMSHAVSQLTAASKIHQFQENQCEGVSSSHHHLLMSANLPTSQPVSQPGSQHHTELRQMQQQRESTSEHQGNKGLEVMQQLHAAAFNQHQHRIVVQQTLVTSM